MQGNKEVDITKYDFNQLAIEWAEKYGIVEYKVYGKILTYIVSYPVSGYESHYTQKFFVDLIEGKTVKSVRMKRYNPKGLVNRH